MKNQIELTQSPIIKHDLKAIGASVSSRIEELNVENLVATSDTIKSMKSLRAELTKEAKEFEAQRKIVKDAVMAPYSEFDGIYKTEVISKYKTAVDILKDKIGGFEMKVKAEKQSNIERYFEELCLNEKIDFLKFAQLNLTIDLSTSEKKYKERCNEFVLKIQDDINLIGSTEHQAEIMAEFKTTLNASKAIVTVRTRKEKEKQEAERILLTRTTERESALRKFGMVYYDMVKSFTLPSNDEVFVKQSDIETLSTDEFRTKCVAIDLKIKEIKLKIVEDAKLAREALITKDESTPAPEVKPEVINAPEVKKPLSAPTEVIKEEVFNAVFEVEGTMAELTALGKYMKSNNINYKNI